MPRPVLRAIALLLGLVVAVTPAASQPGAPMPDWMAGTWVMEDGSAWAEEVWLEPRGELMLGMGRSGFGPQVDGWESTRIVRKRDGSISYIAQPQGGAATEFPMAVTSESAIEFANPAHNFPQRIRYSRQGQLLVAEVSRIDGSGAQRWNYRPLVPAEGGPWQSP